MSAAGAVVVGPKVNGLAAEGAALVDEFLEFLDGHVDWCLWLTELRAVEGNKELLRLVAWEKRQSKRRFDFKFDECFESLFEGGRWVD
jgi:hypothetical protein